jgi:outer membrane lipoprotein-sorting protein
VACALLLAAPGSAVGGDLPSAEEVFARHTEAVGGDALGKVKNVATEFTFSMPSMGVETTGETYIEAPDKSYTRIDFTAMAGVDWEDGANGDVAWQNNPQMGFRVLDGIEKIMALQKTRLDAFATWKDLWETAETVSEEAVGEAACYKVALTAPGGEAVTAWFDKETGRLLQQEIPLPQMGAAVVVKLSDFREVDGVTVPHFIEQEGPMPVIVEYIDLRFNVDDIPEGTFELPEAVKDLVDE